MVHELKIWPQYFKPVKEGLKTFEVRKNDRGFQAGDTVVLNEYIPNESGAGGRYTRDNLEFRIGYVLPIDSERVVLSLCIPKETKKDG